MQRFNFIVANIGLAENAINYLHVNQHSDTQKHYLQTHLEKALLVSCTRKQWTILVPHV